MATFDQTLLAEYPKQPVVKDRNYAALNNWAGGVALAAIPPTPDDAWVKQRIVAERYPAQPMSYVDRTMSYFLQDPNLQNNIRVYLNQWNTENVEISLAAQMEGIIAAFMPRFADIDVTQQQIADWKAAHGIA